MTRTATKITAFGLFLLTALLAIAVYYPGLSGDYMFDDRPNLLENRRLNIDSLDLESLQRAAFSSGSGRLRRPVSMLSFSLNRHFFGIAPYSHKVVNLGIHLLTGLGLFLLSRQLLASYRRYREPQVCEKLVTWLPVVVSGLWLIHPLNLSSVLYIVQRMTSLSALFTVFGLCLYALGRQRMLAGRHGMMQIMTGLVVFGGLALFSKENGALLPLYMLVLEMTLFRFRSSTGGIDRTVTAFFVVVVAVPAGLFLIYLATHPLAVLGGYNGREFTLPERLLTEARVLVFYLKMILMPSITELGLYHDDIPLSHSLLDPIATLFSLLALAMLLLAAFLLWGKRPLVSLGILWFFAGHTLESTIFPLEIAHEHRNYLADYGIILALASAVAQAPLRRLGPVIRTATPVMFLLLFSYTTWLRAGQWSDNISHAVYEARHHPESLRAVFAAGRIHARLALKGHTDSEAQAYAHLKRAGVLDKGGIIPEVTLVKLSFLLGNPVNPEWYDTIIDKLTRYPVKPSDLKSLSELADCIGIKCAVPPQTMDAIFRQVLVNESLPYSPRRHADAYTIYGFYLVNKRGDIHTTHALFREALRLQPQEPQCWINLITLLTVMEKLDEAEKQLALFRAADTHGGNTNDYRRLQKAIDIKRGELASSKEHNPVTNERHDS